jgi:hypothetical protein
VNVTDFHWKHKLCATFSANVNINYVFQSKYILPARANEIIPLINHSFVYKAIEGRHVRITNIVYSYKYLESDLI